MNERLNQLRQPASMWLVYIAVYIPIGFVMNEIGRLMQIAEFANWWQVLTCYGLYLIPASLMARHQSWFDQYLWGLLALALLEICGYTFGTSIAHSGNILDQVFTERNFALCMVVFFAAYIPAGNWVVNAVHRRFFALTDSTVLRAGATTMTTIDR